MDNGSYFTYGPMSHLTDEEWSTFMTQHIPGFWRNGLLTLDSGSYCFIEYVAQWSLYDKNHTYVYRVWRDEQDYIDYARKESVATVAHYYIEYDLNGSARIVGKRNARLFEIQDVLREFLDS